MPENISNEFKKECLILLTGLKNNYMKKLLFISLIFLGCAKESIERNTIVLYGGKRTDINAVASRNQNNLYVQSYNAPPMAGIKFQLVYYPDKNIAIYKFNSSSPYEKDTIRSMRVSPSDKVVNGKYTSDKGFQVECRNIDII